MTLAGIKTNLSVKNTDYSTVRDIP